MHPRAWPPWVWAVLTVIGALIRFDYRVGGASLANAAMLAAVCLAARGPAVRSQLYALPALLALSLPGPAGGPADWGYALGRVAAAWAVARLLEGGDDRPGRPGVLVPLTAMLLTGAAAAWSWGGPDPRLHLRTYYTAVLVLAVLIAFYYTLRLVRRPARIPVLVAGLWPYYAAGIAWTLLFASLGPGGEELPRGLAAVTFHGLVTHLPGDVLTCVLVATFTGPKASVTGRKSR